MRYGESLLLAVSIWGAGKEVSIFPFQFKRLYQFADCMTRMFYTQFSSGRLKNQCNKLRLMVMLEE